MRAVLFGAGGVGRGFLAHLLSESGWQITFVDVDASLVCALQSAGQYTVRLAREGYHRVTIKNVSALEAREAAQVSAAVSEADLLFTAVGGPILPRLAPCLAAGIRLRRTAGIARPLNILICENLPHASSVLRAAVRKEFPDDAEAAILDRVGFAGVVVGRMIPVLPQSWKDEDPLQVIAEDYWVLPVDASGVIPPMPSFTGLQLCDHFPAAEARKLFIHNMFHAVLAYHGTLRGIPTISESVADPFVRKEGEACLRESLAGFLHRYHLDATLEREYAAQLVLRMENPYLMDTVLRVGRDPIRKLGPEDRLIGAARLAFEAGETPTALARAVCAALRFDSSQDASASELQRRLHQDGVLGVLEQVCQLKRDEPLCGLILKSWEGNST